MKNRLTIRLIQVPVAMLLAVAILFQYQCASNTISHLTIEGRQIHEAFWQADTLIHGYLLEGTRYQTPVFHIKGAKEGPAVLIISGTHGNEPAGFEAAHRLLKQFADTPPRKGELFLIPEANKLAARRDSRRIRVPLGVDKEMGNLNRSYPGNSHGLPLEREAQQITELIREHGIDLVFDLHESPVFHLETLDNAGDYHGLGQTLIYTPNEEATWLAMVVLDELNSTIPPGVKQFSPAPGPVKHSAAWSAGEYFQIPAFTTETCRQLPLEERIQYHLQIVRIVLNEMGML